MKSAEKHLATTYETAILESKAHRSITAFMADALQPYSLSIPQWSTLGSIGEHTTLRPFQIAEMLGVRPPVATALVNELETKELIVRKVHATDSRATVIVLTRKGRQLAGKVEKRLHADMQDFFGEITLPELNVYVRVLAKIAAKA